MGQVPGMRWRPRGKSDEKACLKGRWSEAMLPMLGWTTPMLGWTTRTPDQTTVKVALSLALASMLVLTTMDVAGDASWVATRGDRREGGRLDLKMVFVGKSFTGFRTCKRFRGWYLKGLRR